MVLSFFGENLNEEDAARLCQTSWLGTTCEQIANAANEISFEAEIFEWISEDYLSRVIDERKPIIALIDPRLLYEGFMGGAHFVVVIGLESNKVIYHDPNRGENIKASKTIFFNAWQKFEFLGVVIWKSMKK